MSTPDFIASRPLRVVERALMARAEAMAMATANIGTIRAIDPCTAGESPFPKLSRLGRNKA
jgi:hypothetical protein